MRGTLAVGLVLAVTERDLCTIRSEAERKSSCTQSTLGHWRRHDLLLLSLSLLVMTTSLLTHAAIDSSSSSSDRTIIAMLKEPMISRDQHRDGMDANDIITAAESVSPSHPTESSEYRVYPSRWLQLFLLSSLSMTNAILWINFASIADLASSYYRVSSLWINMLSISFMIFYLPGYLLSMYCINFLRTTFFQVYV